MLKLSGIRRNASSRLAPMSASWQKPLQKLSAACSGAANLSPKLAQTKVDKPRAKGLKSEKKETPPSKNLLIQTALDALKVSGFQSQDTGTEEATIERIKASTTVRGLLEMIDVETITAEHARTTVTILMDWVNNGKAKLSDFDLDSRFLHLCDLIAQSKPSKQQTQPRKLKSHELNHELSLMYGLNDIDDVIKEISNVSISHMIQVMKRLAQQKRRTTPLLTSLCYDISRSKDVLNIKQASDILYSMAVLNYSDEALLEKISNDIIGTINTVNKSPIIGSIVTSLGILRYKNTKLMDELSTWYMNNSKDVRRQDLCSYFITLAMLGHIPSESKKIKKIIIDPLEERDMPRPTDWLNVVWAWTILQLAENRHIESILNKAFVAKIAIDIETPNVFIPRHRKLLVINGAAQYLTTNYNGPLLEENSQTFASMVQRSKEKQMFTQSVTVALAEMFPPPEYMKVNVDLGTGFLVDTEICIDSNGDRLPVASDLKTTKGFRIAVMSLSYNDFCRGKHDPMGFYEFYFRILEAKGYKILSIPYTEYSTQDEMSSRILYIRNRIKKMLDK
ncbi:FAST kinase domain-containing protein 4 [Venturia canescens]|uniref:FAST kinase domain-containing protein 4 n=1 Tax=Venturia canescens TaxID=32260 RepID=UPI001C9D4959|nr:FAST kinase domain-containing protein 4 [Venturia canescens]XP_043271697.1 FAST kinase domain-containing protein 4 [Venturia canescens]XP_043271698.1 FAST kinase domain-containing protein 4 [Venturia canescens]